MKAAGAGLAFGLLWVGLDGRRSSNLGWERLQEQEGIGSCSRMKCAGWLVFLRVLLHGRHPLACSSQVFHAVLVPFGAHPALLSTRAWAQLCRRLT